MMRSTILVCSAALLASLAAAECPNACSGHGTCGARDMCTCYRNWQSADCSERTCPFGSAHVDTARGDLDGSGGALAIPSQTSGTVNQDIIAGSTVYPQGAAETLTIVTDESGTTTRGSIDNAAHAYMECSNKGLCDRKTGECECFEAYEGTACQRASCPNECSGHGTCETIQELAEDREFGDVTGMIGNSNTLKTFGGYTDKTTETTLEAFDTTPGQNQATHGTYSSGGVPYFLWDRRSTMGCKCDAGYFGADCSLRRCKYGVDPLFLNSGTASYETVEVGVWADVSAATAADAGYAAQWDMTFYDVFGEDYTIYDMKAGFLRDNTGSALYGRNGDAQTYYTTCAQVSALFPNEMLGDTSTTVPFCTYTAAGDCDEGTTAELGICVNGDYLQTSNDDAAPAAVAAVMADDYLKATDASATQDYHKWLFQYGKGNPGFIKDAKVRNLRDARNDMEQTIGAAVPSIFSQANAWKTPTFYMKKSADGEWSDYTTSSNFDFFLPGYLKFAINSGQDLYFSENINRYVTGSTTDTQKSNMIQGPNNGGTATDFTIEATNGVLGAYTFGLTPLDFPRAGAASGWNTFTYGSRVDVGGSTNYGAALDMENALLNSDNVYKTKITTNYEYVTMCSNRGTCDTDAGVCKCFSGYTNDNCDTQTAII